MKVSIVIPAYNEEDCIERCIKSVLNQNYKDLEVILVDDGSTDKTVEIAKKYPIKIIKGQHEGNSVAKNLGWREAKGDIVIFIDADMVIHPNYVSETVKCYKKKGVGGTAHREQPFNKNPSFIARMLNLRKAIGLTHKPICIKSCRRFFLKTVGGYDPDFGYYDDWELGIKIENSGYKVVWSRGKVWHEDIEKLDQLIRQCRWMGKSITFKKYKLNATKKLLYTLLCTGLPLFIFLLFLGFPFWIFGAIGVFSFLAIESYRTLKIFFFSKKLESFLTFLFDYITMTFVFIGFVDKLFGKTVKI
jgi:glycosyltransferase involved in cell wall biosynthesis